MSSEQVSPFRPHESERVEGVLEVDDTQEDLGVGLPGRRQLLDAPHEVREARQHDPLLDLHQAVVAAPALVEYEPYLRRAIVSLFVNAG